MIHARNLTRKFKSKKETVLAVKNLSLDVGEGELVAFLGPNGAGKSTSLRMLTTLLPPTSGSASVAGFDVSTESGEVRRRIGYVGQGSGAGQYHKLYDELLTQGSICRLEKGEARRRAAELIDKLELNGLEGRVGTSLSGGQKRRLDIALGLMHRPQILFLDEPSTGLDPQSRANLWSHILKLRAETGMTVFMTTHYLDEADVWAERVMIMDKGEMIASDTPERLKANLAGDRITLTFEGSDVAGKAAGLAQNLPDARDMSVRGQTVSLVAPNGEALLPQLIVRLAESGAPATSAALKRPTLDDVFLELTGRSLRETSTIAA